MLRIAMSRVLAVALIICPSSAVALGIASITAHALVWSRATQLATP